jgi:hypothetical protein
MGMICPFELGFKIQDCKIHGYKHPCMLSCRDEPTREKNPWDESFKGYKILGLNILGMYNIGINHHCIS